MTNRWYLYQLIALSLWMLNGITTADICSASTSSDNSNNSNNKSNGRQCIINPNNSFTYQWDPKATHPCNIVRMTWKEVQAKFGSKGLPPMYPHPLVITTLDEHSRNPHFCSLSQEDQIIHSFPADFNVTLSSSNSFSEHRRIIPFKQYLQEMEQQVEQLPDQRSNETFYLFGETYSDEWKQFLSSYQIPLCEACMKDSVALSFGIGNRGSGVQWHVHGPGFSEAIVGRKRTLLACFAAIL